jgi:benzil reductase ((S)-benzoin forming)
LLKTNFHPGAGSGIGRAISLHLANQGITVFAVGRRISKLEETKNLAGNKNHIQIITADVTSEEGRTIIHNMISNQSKKLRYLIHNAGVVGPLVPLEKLTLDGYQKTMTTNVEAPIFLTQRLLPLLTSEIKETGHYARVLHVSSGCAHNPSVSWLSYCVSKAAFLMAYKCLALEFKNLNLGVLCGSMKPGIVDSEMQDEMRKSSETDFPKVKRFKDLRQGLEKKLEQGEVPSGPHLPDVNALDTADNVAHFTWFLLTKTSNEEYDTVDWDIRDEELVKRWVG